jgi:drug/metabolite transporter (DMT)-like permease
VLFGALLLGEPVTWSLLLGGSLVVGGLFLTNRRAK